MIKEKKYYFVFDSTFLHPKTGESLNDYWTEIIGDENTLWEGTQGVIYVVSRLYKTQWNGKLLELIYDEKSFKKIKKKLIGCHEKIYLPLPEEITIENQEPFLSKPRPLSEEIDELKYCKTKFAKVLFDRQCTLKEISQQTGISYPTLIGMKTGRKKNYRARILHDIAAYLNVGVDDII